MSRLFGMFSNNSRDTGPGFSDGLISDGLIADSDDDPGDDLAELRHEDNASNASSARSDRLTDRNMVKDLQELKSQLKQQAEEMKLLKRQYTMALEHIEKLKMALNLERNVKQCSDNTTSSSSSSSSSFSPDETANHTEAEAEQQIDKNPEINHVDHLTDTEEVISTKQKDVKSKKKPTNKVKSSANIPSKNTQSARQETSPKSNTNVREENKSVVKRVPPIVTYGLNHKEKAEELTKVLGHNNFSMETVNNTCSVIRCNSLQTHKQILSELKDKVDHHTFTPNEERNISIVMKNLSPTYDAADIKEALEGLKLEIMLHSVTPYVTDTSVRQKKKLRIWLIQLNPGSDAKALLKTRGILNQIVKFEMKKQSRIPQCKNCQKFGHTASNCNRRYRCVKCVGDHRPRECPLNVLRNDSAVPLKPKCVNCGGDHAASFRGCKEYTNFVKRKAERAKQLHEEQLQKSKSINNYVQSGLSYSDAARGANKSSAQFINDQPNSSQAQHTQQTHHSQQSRSFEENSDFLNQECLKHFQKDFMATINELKTFQENYTRMSTAEQQVALWRYLSRTA